MGGARVRSGGPEGLVPGRCSSRGGVGASRDAEGRCGQAWCVEGKRRPAIIQARECTVLSGPLDELPVTTRQTWRRLGLRASELPLGLRDEHLPARFE